MTSDDLVLKLKDPKFYLENLCKIKVKQGGLEPFILNNAQRDLFNTLRKHNRIACLKARQIGFSTAITGFLYHKTITTPGINVALIGYNSDLTRELLDKVKTFYRTTPESLRPPIQYNSKFEVTFPKVESKIVVLPSSENVGRGYTLSAALCVSGDTFVYKRNGHEVRVRDLRDGCEILNGRGSYSRVNKVIEKSNKEELLALDVVGSPEGLKITKDHQVLVRGDDRKPVWVRAADLVEGARIGVPYFQCRHRVKEVDLDEFFVFNHRGLSPKKLGRKKTNFTLGLFVGWYLAEGSLGENRVTFSVHRNEVEEIKKVVSDVFGNLLTPHIRFKGNGATVTYHNKSLKLWLEAYFGKLASKKIINDKIWYWGWDFAKGLLVGLFRGDGCFKNIRCCHLVTTSQPMVAQIKRLLVSLRIGLPSTKRSSSSRYGIDGLERWDVVLSGPANYKFRKICGLPLPNYDTKHSKEVLNSAPGANLGARSWRRGKDYYWAKIRSIKTESVESTVYDIVLDGEPHSFMTHAGVVHNCTELAFWDKAEEKMTALEAAIPATGQLVIETTPNGIGNMFHRIWMNDKNDYVKKQYGWWWHYSEEEIEVIRRRMDPQKFAQEYELTFLTAGRGVFSAESLERQKANILNIGDKVPDTDRFVEKKSDGLIVFHPPEPDGFYVVGCDTSEGVIGGDFSGVTIWNRKNGEEVASFRDYVAPDKLAGLLNKWGRYYNNALMVVEVNNHGLTVLTLLKNLLYPNIYFRPSKFDAISSPTSDRMGWKTTKVTRDILIDDFVEAIREGSLTVHSKHLLDEMTTFIYDGDTPIAAEGYHDDSIFSAAIGLQGFKVMYDKPLEQIDYGRFLPQTHSY